MGKGVFKKFANEAKRQARKGKLDVTFAVRGDDIETLKNEGFTVDVPRTFCDEKMAVKNLVEVHVSWAVPTGKGHLARKLNGMVESYRSKCNTHRSTKRHRVIRQTKTSIDNIQWVAGMDYISAVAAEGSFLTSADIEDEEFEEFYDKYPWIDEDDES